MRMVAHTGACASPRPGVCTSDPLSWAPADMHIHRVLGIWATVLHVSMLGGLLESWVGLLSQGAMHIESRLCLCSTWVFWYCISDVDVGCGLHLACRGSVHDVLLQ